MTNGKQTWHFCHISYSGKTSFRAVDTLYLTVLHNYFWGAFVLNVYKFITFATVCKYGAKTCIHLLCFTGKCGPNTRFDSCANMTKENINMAFPSYFLSM